MAADIFYLPFRPAIDANGLTVSGAKLHFYNTGTTTPISIYADSDLTTELTNPVEANAAGAFPTIYLDESVTYRVVLKNADGATLSDADPYFTDLSPITRVSGESGTSYTLDLADENAVVVLTNASAITLTIPPDSAADFAIGSYVEIHQGGAGQVTPTAGSGVTLNVKGGLTKTSAQHAIAAIRKTAANTWILTGDLV